MTRGRLHPAGALAALVALAAAAGLAGCGSSARRAPGAAAGHAGGSLSARRAATAQSAPLEHRKAVASPAGRAATAVPAAAIAPSRQAAQSKPLHGQVLTLDPGHNGGNFSHPQQIARLVNDGNGEKECDTTGTAGPDGYRETDFNWSVALRLRALLLAAGGRVVMTRESNAGVGPCITERAATGNHARSDAAISIHADGGPPDGSGFAILVPAPIPSRADQAIIGPSRALALALRGSLLRIGLHPSSYDGAGGLAPRTDLGGLNLSRVPKVFVEVANMRNPADEAPMERPAFREHVAHALLAGLERFVLRGR